MHPLGVLVALGSVLAVACGRDKSVSPLAATSLAPGASALSSASSTASPASPAATATASGSVEPERVGDAQCLSAEERAQDLAVSFKLRGPLAVVRVAPDDVLWLRQGPGAREKPLGKLAHDARQVATTGRVCRTGDTTWYEVTSGSERGFANGKYLVPATEPADATPRFAKLLGGTRATTPEELAGALKDGLKREQTEPSEVRFDATLLGVARSGTRAVVVLHACCYADDSVMGEQIWLDALERDGRWVLERARVIKLCPRGASSSACI
jgi:hypothetical protein